MTQNFAEPRHFEAVWKAVGDGRGDLITEFYKKLAISRPDLAVRADEMGGVAAVQKSLDVPDLFASLLDFPGEMSSSEDEPIHE